MNGNWATFKSCFFASSSNFTPFVQALIGTALSVSIKLYFVLLISSIFLSRSFLLSIHSNQRRIQACLFSDLFASSDRHSRAARRPDHHWPRRLPIQLLCRAGQGT